MNKNNRKKKGLSKRVLALMLCCFCLLATIPISAFASETGETQITEGNISEQQSESTGESLLSLSSETSESQTETDTQQSTSDEIIEPIIENETGTEIETEVNSETRTETGMEGETETGTENGSETGTGTGTDVGTVTVTKTEMETDGETGSGTGGEITPDESGVSNVQDYTDALNLDAVSVYKASGTAGNGNMKIAAVYYDTAGNCHILVDVTTNNLGNAVSKMQGYGCYVEIDPLVGDSITVKYPDYIVSARDKTLTLNNMTLTAGGAGFADINVGLNIKLSELFNLTLKATTGQGDNSWNINGEEVEVVIEYDLNKTVSKDGTTYHESVVVEPGDVITYKIVVENFANSNVSLTGVELKDVLPEGVFDLDTVQYRIGDGEWKDCDDSTAIVLDSNLIVEKGSSVTYYMTAAVRSDLKVTIDTTYTNTAYTSGNTIVGDSDTAEFVVEAPKVCNLTISKTVGGNMGDQSKEFVFTATLLGEGYSFDGVTYSIDGREAQSVGDGTTCDFTLKHGQSITFTGLPIGAAFTVTETPYSESGYVTTVDGETVSSKTITLDETNRDIAFVNRKDVTVDTGVLLDTLPYILILGVVAVGAVLLIKKRRNRDDD